VPLLVRVKKYCRAGQTTDENMTHAHCMLDTTNTRTQTHTRNM